MYTSVSARRFGLGDSLDTLAGDGLSNAYAADPALAQLHQIALIIVALKQQWNDYLNPNTDSPFDPNVLTTIAQQIQYYVEQMQSLRASINQTTANMNTLGWFDQAFLDVGQWANDALKALPTTLSAIPNALIDALGKIAANLGKNAVQSLVGPALVIGGLAFLAIELTKRAESTRTGKAIARRI